MSGNCALLSVVIQGPLYRGAPEGIERCLASIRAQCPGAEVIVSTWETEPWQGLDADRVVLSKDPGGFTSRSYTNNVNRQARSTLAGLEVATRPLALKFRADHALASTRMLALPAAREGSLFVRPVVAPTLFVRNPEKFPMLFHMTDLVQFGLTEDLYSFWDGPEFARDYLVHETPVKGSHFMPRTTVKLVPEQALTLRWAQRAGLPVYLRRADDITPELAEQWADLLVRNFSLVDWQDSGVVFPRRFQGSSFSLDTVLRAEELQRIAERGFDYEAIRRRLRYTGPLTLGWWRWYLAAELKERSPQAHALLKKAYLQLRAA